MRKAPLLLLPMLLAGCTVAVEYGDIPHNVLAENPRCNPAQNDSASVSGKDYFIVTSRLPDCRGDNIKLTNDLVGSRHQKRSSPPRATSNWWCH
jgi:hypothetical protein